VANVHSWAIAFTAFNWAHNIAFAIARLTNKRLELRDNLFVYSLLVFQSVNFAVDFFDATAGKAQHFVMR